MSESYFLESFIGGLRPTIKSFVKAFNPLNLCAAMEIAKLQEETIHALKTPQIERANPAACTTLNPYYEHQIWLISTTYLLISIPRASTPLPIGRNLPSSFQML